MDLNEKLDFEVCPECISLHDCEANCACKFKEYLDANTDVAHQRSETPEQLLGANINLVICFPGGAGGHFIASICSALLNDDSYGVLNNGSMHAFPNKDRSARPLDTSLDSLIQEYQYLNNLTDFEIMIGHFRNLVLLQQLGKKIIYIEFNAHNKEEINRRKNRKVSNRKINKEVYNMLSGDSWPTWEDYRSGVIVPELDSNIAGINGNNDLDDWYYIIPSNCDNLCKISFDEILDGYEFVNKLVNFLNVSQFDEQKIYNMIDIYRNNQ